jgi:hypothetical protein
MAQQDFQPIFGYGPPPNGIFQAGRQYFDMNTTPWTSYVYTPNGVWQKHGSNQ